MATVFKAGKGTGKKGPNGSGTWHRGKGADAWPSGKIDDGGRKGGKKGSKDSKPILHSDKEKGSKGKGKGKGEGKSETRYCYDCGEQVHIGVNCPYKWANSVEKEDDQTSSREKERMLKNSRAWKRMTKKESGAGLRRAESPDQEWKRVQRTRRREHQGLRAADHVRQDPSGIRAQEHMAGRGHEEASGVSLPHHPSWERSVHWEG